MAFIPQPGNNSLLRAEYEANSPYYQELARALQDLEACLGPKEVDKYVGVKLLTRRSAFDVDEYVQGAAELTVIRHFARMYPETFEYEPRLCDDSGKNVECSVRLKHTQFNIEVKVARHDRRFQIEDSPGLKIESDGRLDGFSDLTQELTPLLTITDPVTGAPVSPKISFKQDNTVFDFLASAHSKFAVGNPLNHFNALFVGCGNSDDVQEYYHHLTGPTGLFTKNAFRDPAEFNHVDAVFLTNLYFKHTNRYGKLDKASWQLGECFVLCVPNPLSERHKFEASSLAMEAIPSLTKEFSAYREGNGKKVWEFMILKHFIHGELGEKQGRYYF
jgi:hypothetical protein